VKRVGNAIENCLVSCRFFATISSARSGTFIAYSPKLLKLRGSGMFRLADHLLVGKRNAGRMERDGAREIEHIPAGMTFVDGAPFGYECSCLHDRDVNAKQKMRRSPPAMKIDIRSTAAR
jgi:hypothetical protein